MKDFLYGALAYAAIMGCTIYLLNRATVPLPCVAPVVETRKSLPEICAPFYNDGTGRWADCMGVGPK